MIAAVLSMVVLFGWSYFFTPPKPPAETANTAANANSAPVPTQATLNSPVPQQTAPETAAATPDTTPNRQITIKSPLYEVKLDSKGALATSWILLKNKSEKAEYPLYADGSNDA